MCILLEAAASPPWFHQEPSINNDDSRVQSLLLPNELPERGDLQASPVSMVRVRLGRSLERLCDLRVVLLM